jgi:mono/diheme cytochrome c family protein
MSILVGLALIFTVSAGSWQRPVAAASGPDGAELFTTYCASCHGAEGLGNGPVAHALRHAPANLTELARKNGGIFPMARVRRIIEGRDVESHGDRDMPVWGDAFKTTRDGGSRESADARIAAIAVYLESIQRREAQ